LPAPDFSNVALLDNGNNFSVSQSFSSGLTSGGPFFLSDGSSGVISGDGSGGVIIDSTSSISIGPNAPSNLNLSGVATAISGGDSLSLSSAGSPVQVTGGFAVQGNTDTANGHFSATNAGGSIVLDDIGGVDIYSPSNVSIHSAGTITLADGGAISINSSGNLNSTGSITAVSFTGSGSGLTNLGLPTGHNPTATIGLTANNGSASTFLRSDGAPALSQAIVPTWTGTHTFGPKIIASGGMDSGAGVRLTSGGASFSLSGGYSLTFNGGPATGTTPGILVSSGSAITYGYALKIQPTLTTTCNLLCQAVASQTANIQEWQNSSATVVANLDTTGALTCAARSQFTGGIALAESTIRFRAATDGGHFMGWTGSNISIVSSASVIVGKITTGSSGTFIVAQDKFTPALIVRGGDPTVNNLTDIQEWTNGGGTIYNRVDKLGYFITAKTTAPADADLNASECAFWFDNTNGAGKFNVKAKTANGTVVTGQVALT
jgi:hypothetical protein